MYIPFYSRWKNKPDNTTPVVAEAMDRIDDGIRSAHEQLDGRLSQESLDAAYGGGGASPIDDASSAPDKTWSAEKQSLLTRFLIPLDPTDPEAEWVEAVTGESVGTPNLNTDMNLQYATGIAYMLAAMNNISYSMDSQVMVPGTLTVGDTANNRGFYPVPAPVPGFNTLMVTAITLDTPSTSGQVRFRLIVRTPQGYSAGQEFIIPEGETLWLPEPGSGGSAPNFDYWDAESGKTKYHDVMVAEIFEAGTGASGLRVQVARST